MRTLQRIAAFCFIVAFSTFLFYIGREHQIFIDNKTIELEDESFRALKFVRVSVNDASPIELMARERDLVKVVGPSFMFRVEVMDEYGEEVEKVIEKELRLGFGKNVMLSMPLLALDRDDYILPPPTLQAPPPEQDTPPGGDEGLIPTGEMEMDEPAP
ncbi:MAG: hypothetical protein FWG09_06755 [Synergistaceae bacterium]|nr:hypothetical protein [Synergistaceae bacterium]